MIHKEYVIYRMNIVVYFMQERSNLGYILNKVKEYITKTSGLTDLASDLMLLSEVWREDNLVHLIMHVPDIVGGKLAYVKKHIIYDLSNDDIVSMRNV